MEESHRVKAEERFEQGLEQGIEKGKRDSTIAIARNLLISGLSASQISDSTGLSTDDIMKIEMEL